MSFAGAGKKLFFCGMIRPCLFLPLLLAGVLGVGGCSRSSDTAAESPSSVEGGQATPVTAKPEPRMQPSDARGYATLEGRHYAFSIHREPDEKLPRVALADGSLYFDNSIHLTVERTEGGGSTLLDRRFTKDDFARVVDANFLRHGILEGIVFDRVEGSRLLFAVSICYPNTDLYMAARLYVSPSGQIAVEREDAMNDAPAPPDAAAQEGEGDARG